MVEALEGLRGVPCTVAVTMVAELGDLTRVENPRHVTQYLGLIPQHMPAGSDAGMGAITNAGNTQARHALVEGAWVYRDPAQVSRHLQRRLETPLQVIQGISWNAQVRLGQRSRRVIARGTHAHQGVVAMARQLAGFLWAIAQQVSVTPSGRLPDGHVTPH